MQMFRELISKPSPDRKQDERIDLDEKIRRIREKNKAREKRFKEVEDDKMQAEREVANNNRSSSGSTKIHVLHSRYNGQAKTDAQALVRVSRRKVAKGRGQRLLEMSREPLKAGDFESRAKEAFLDEKYRLEWLEGFSTDNSKMAEGKNLLINQRKFGKRPENSDIASSTYNPLVDDRYLDKPKKNDKNNEYHGFTIHSKTAETQLKSVSIMQRDILGKSITHAQEHATKPKRNQAAGQIWVEKNNRQENPADRWSVEDVNGKVKEKLTIGKSSVNNKYSGGDMLTNQPDGIPRHDKGKQADRDMTEDVGPKAQEYKLGANLSKIGEVHEVLKDHQPTEQKPDTINEELSSHPCTEQTFADKVQNDSKQEHVSAAENKILESTDPKWQREKKPKITVNTKVKKTVSSSSFDEVMSTLSPIDVPSNWGDCDDDDEFTDENFEPTF